MLRHTPIGLYRVRGYQRTHLWEMIVQVADSK